MDKTCFEKMIIEKYKLSAGIKLADFLETL